MFTLNNFKGQTILILRGGLGKYPKNSCIAFAEEKRMHSEMRQRSILQTSLRKFMQSI